MTPKSLGFTFEDFQEALKAKKDRSKNVEVVDEKECKDEEDGKKSSLRPKTAKRKGPAYSRIEKSLELFESCGAIDTAERVSRSSS